jgi:hypothetical protein
MRTFVSSQKGADNQQDMKLYAVSIFLGEDGCRRTP